MLSHFCGRTTLLQAAGRRGIDVCDVIFDGRGQSSVTKCDEWGLMFS